MVQACETPVSEGLEIVTLNPRITEARRLRLNELLSNHNAYCEPPCHYACPAGIDIPGYLAAIARGDDAEAVRIVKERLPLPRIIGRVCPRPCESACRRTQVDGQAGGHLPVEALRGGQGRRRETASTATRDRGSAHGQEGSRDRQRTLRPHGRLLSGPRRPRGDHLRGRRDSGRHDASTASRRTACPARSSTPTSTTSSPWG